jgi:hypothetical protein
MLRTRDARDRRLFESLAGNEAWRIHHVRDLAEAVRVVGKRLFRAIVCDAGLGGGICRELLHALPTARRSRAWSCCRHTPGGSLWAEALNPGAYGL